MVERMSYQSVNPATGKVLKKFKESPTNNSKKKIL
jgi:hypothetical protein